MSGTSIKLPYFDAIFSELNKGNADVEKAFGRHVHWGYWEDPESADGAVSDFAEATERLCRMICDAAGIKNNMRVLDVGCGFGGTLASLNERFSPLDLVGVNIDKRQLQRAEEKVKPLKGNTIKFVCGNGSFLPFADNSFDAVLAVECIFHFPDRGLFFREARRVLRMGGRLAFSDFVPSRKTPFLYLGLKKVIEGFVAAFYGKTSYQYTPEEYRAYAMELGLKPLLEQDITAGTMPTYPLLIHLFKHLKMKNFILPYLSTRLVEWVHRLGIQKYEILVYEKLVKKG